MNGQPEDLAGFDVLNEIGRGSRTVVYRVRRHGGEYAMKVVQSWTGPEFSERGFHREAALLACANHPGVARVHEVGTVSNQPYLIMDYIPGQHLTKVLARGPLPLDRILAVGVDVADGLGAAHRARIVHRDVKPDNIVIRDDSRAQVVDFGLALAPGETDDGSEYQVAGTLLYSAPEQSGVLNRPVDSRADLYSLGAVLFECATGQPPFLAADLGSLLRMHATTPAPDPRILRPDLPKAFSRIVARLLAKDPDDRYSSADGLIADLKRLAADPYGEPFAVGLADRPLGWMQDYPLIGRDHELQALLNRWSRVQQGDGGVGLIRGGAGAGKSRVGRELVDVVSGGGALVLTAKCEQDETVPLAPIRRAMDLYVEELRNLPEPVRSVAVERFAAAVGPGAGLLRWLSPALADLLGAPEQVERPQQFANLLARMFVALARASGGAMLLFDDFQWLDEATRRVLQRTVAELAGVPLMIVVTQRAEDPSEPPPSWLDEDLVDLTVTLGPLSVADTADLIAEATGGVRVSPGDAGRLAALGGGNPFTVLEYLWAAIGAGLMRPSWGNWVVDVERLHQVELPTDTAALVLGRLRGLDPRSQYLLGMGAIIGHRFDAGLVAQACGVPTDDVVSVADAAAWRHLLERGASTYAFVHDRIRDALLTQFDAASRRALHDRVAETLERRGGTDRDSVYALALHAGLGDAAVNPARVLRTSAAAGLLALKDQAPAEALAFLMNGAQVAPEAGIELDAEYLYALGLAQHRTGQFRDAIQTMRRAHGRSQDPVQRAQILNGIARVYDSTWATDRQAETIDEALADLGRPMPRGRLNVALSSVGYFVAGSAVRLTRIGYGTVRGRSRQLNLTLARLYEAGALAHTRQLRPLMGAAFAVRQRYVVGRIGWGADLPRAAIAEAFLVNALGLRRVARRLADAALRTAAQVNDPQAIAYVAWMDGFLRQASGQDQGQRIRRALAEHGQWLDVGSAIDLVHTLCFDALLRGDKDVLTETFHRREALLAASDQSTQVARHASTAGLLALRGRCADAKDWLEQMRLEAGARPLRWQIVDIFYGTVMVAVECDEYGEEFDDAVAAFEAHGFAPGTLIPAELGLYVYVAYGRLEQCRAAGPDERPARLAQARTAVATARRAARSVMQRAHALVLHASLRQVAGEHERALRELDAAAPVLRRADAALLAFESARVRTFALRALRINGEAARQADHALAIAGEQEWPQRAARAAGEFGRPSTLAALASSRRYASPVDMMQARSSDRIALSRYRQRLEAVEQVSFAASRVLDPDRLVSIGLDEIIRILNAERAFLFLIEGEPPRLVPHHGRTAQGQDLRELTGYSTTLVERVRRTQSPLVVTGTEEGAALGAQSVLVHDLRSIIIAPLQIERRLLGVVYLDSRVAKGIFTNDDVGVLIAIVNQIAVALETARAAQLEVAVAAANEQREVAEMLRDALADIGTTLEPAQVLRRLLTTVLNRTTGEAGWLLLARPDGPKARLVTGADAVESIVDIDERLRRLLRIDAVEVHNAPTAAPDVIMKSFPQARSWLAVPLTTQDERLGILLLAARASHAYDEGAAQVVVALAGQGMVAYEKAQLFSQVQRLATTDSLTSVANRRHFFDEAAQRMLRSRRLGLPLTAMMVDIDEFKQINDEHGHQVGDEVIQAVAARLQRQGRSGDLLGRYGGEEFAILQQSGDDDARIAERLRTAISETPIDTAAGPVRVTVSIGLSQLRAGDATVSSLLARADQLMYEAKRAGRNRVEVG